MKLFRRKKIVRRADLASHWVLMWWKFTEHNIAVFGVCVLVAAALASLFSPFLTPYGPSTRNLKYKLGTPMRIHFFDENGLTRPYVYGRKTERDSDTLEMLTIPDESQIWKIYFFVKGEKYTLLWFLTSDIHLFGVRDDAGKFFLADARKKGPFIHLLGTDEIGRDFWSRLLRGGGVSIGLGLLSVSFGAVIGIVIGGFAGFMGGIVDFWVMRLIEFFNSIPSLPIWLLVGSLMPDHWTNMQVYIAITVFLALLGWMGMARTIRSLLLSIKNEDYINAARLSGASTSRIIFRHMMPSFFSYIIVSLSLSFPSAILGETSLSFLGLGLREPTVSLGVLLSDVKYVRNIAMSPWLLIAGLYILVIILAFNYTGDGLRDAADPYTKVSR